MGRFLLLPQISGQQNNESFNRWVLICWKGSTKQIKLSKERRKIKWWANQLPKISKKSWTEKQKLDNS